MPAGLLVPPGNSVSLHFYAIGVQIYDWTVNAINSTQAAWVLKAPEAALFNADGKLIGYHYGGPTWENRSGRSYVQAVVMQRGTPDSNAAPWLLLRAKNAAKHGMFARIIYIQRVNTTGGLPPTTAGDHIGKQTRVPYMAEYYFYREQSQDSPVRPTAAMNLINNGGFYAPVGDAATARLGCAYPPAPYSSRGRTSATAKPR